MENSDHQILGARKLNEAEIALMNEGKALAEACGAYIDKLRTYKDSTRMNQVYGPTEPEIDPPLNQRWISIGATDLQKGWMSVIRGIAQPTTF